MKRNLFLCLVLIAALTFASCSKDESASIVPSETVSPWTSGILAAYLKSNAPTAQSFTINAADSISQVQTASGNVYIFPDNAFQNADGTAAQGTINIEITEILKKSDMFFAGINTMGDGQLISSDNMAYIKASSNGKELKLNKDKKYTIRFHTLTDSASIYAFQGGRNDKGIISWSQKTYSGAMAIQNIDSLKDSLHQYFLLSDSLHWVNCDHFVNSIPAVNVTISLADKTTYDEAAVAVIFKKEKSVVLLDPVIKKFNQYAIANLPSGRQATIVVLAKKNGAYYATFQPFTVTDQLTTLSLQPTDAASFTSSLKALD
jgi:hypothetical protein